MHFKALCLAVVLGLAPLVAHAQTAEAPPSQFKAVKIVLIGDSTTAVQGGWGPAFCGWHITSFAACVNLGRGGRSSGNYRAEGSWALAMDEIKSGGFVDTYVLIQFGHNDQPGKPGRSTDLVTEFPANMKRYVEEVRAAGAKPVLVTPLTRRSFKDGKLVDDLGPWAEAVRKVAAETNTPLVDLHARSAAAVQAMGPVEAMKFAQRPPPLRSGGGRQDGHDDRGQSRAGGSRRCRDARRTEQRRCRADGPGQALVRLHSPGPDRSGLFRRAGRRRTGQGDA
jgi:lysophospholipase L1-like esterase